MPITYQIDHQYKLVRTHAVGVLTDEDLLGHKRKLAADPQFTAGMRELSDVREVTDLQITAEGVRSMVNTDASQASKLEDYRLAIVAGQEVVFGMARMYEILVEQHVPNVSVFRDYREAARWLGLPLVDH